VLSNRNPQLFFLNELAFGYNNLRLERISNCIKNYRNNPLRYASFRPFPSGESKTGLEKAFRGADFVTFPMQIDP
jgi:hypothetical protein